MELQQETTNQSARLALLESQMQAGLQQFASLIQSSRAAEAVANAPEAPSEGTKASQETVTSPASRTSPSKNPDAGTAQSGTLPIFGQDTIPSSSSASS